MNKKNKYNKTMMVDTRENGQILPELPGKRILLRVNSTTLILPRREKVSNKREYINQFVERINKDRERHG